MSLLLKQLCQPGLDEIGTVVNVMLPEANQGESPFLCKGIFLPVVLEVRDLHLMQARSVEESGIGMPKAAVALDQQQFVGDIEVKDISPEAMAPGVGNAHFSQQICERLFQFVELLSCAAFGNQLGCYLGLTLPLAGLGKLSPIGLTDFGDRFGRVGFPIHHVPSAFGMSMSGPKWDSALDEPATNGHGVRLAELAYFGQCFPALIQANEIHLIQIFIGRFLRMLSGALNRAKITRALLLGFRLDFKRLSALKADFIQTLLFCLLCTCCTAILHTPAQALIAGPHIILFAAFLADMIHSSILSFLISISSKVLIQSQEVYACR